MIIRYLQKHCSSRKQRLLDSSALHIQQLLKIALWYKHLLMESMIQKYTKLIFVNLTKLEEALAPSLEFEASKQESRQQLRVRKTRTYPIKDQGPVANIRAETEKLRYIAQLNASNCTQHCLDLWFSGSFKKRLLQATRNHQKIGKLRAASFKSRKVAHFNKIPKSVTKIPIVCSSQVIYGRVYNKECLYDRSS